jgi:ribosome biogenesis GTPase
VFLKSIGADDAVFRAFEPYNFLGLELARVAESQRDQYRLLTETGERNGEPSGRLRYRTSDNASLPAVGDWVAARLLNPREALVEAVLPRRSAFSRRAAGTRAEEQVVAANIDLLFVICGLDGDFNLRRIERYLTLAAAGGASPVIVLNKADLCARVSERVEETSAISGKTPVLAVSARTGAGLETLRTYVAGELTVALVGSSGAGKSTLSNWLLGSERLLTGEVRESDSRGRHITTHRELAPLPGGGALIDTPGLREIQLWAERDSVKSVFEEVADLAAQCRFRDCTHAGEPGCAVEAALHAGTLPPDRLASFQKLMQEAKRHEEENDRLSAQRRKGKVKELHRALRRHPKYNR